MKTLTWDDIEREAKKYEGRGPRLAQYAEFINANFPQYEAEMEDWSYTPQRHLFGHVSHFGKRREGKRLVVYQREYEGWGRPKVLEHNPLEPYRRNNDVAHWIISQKKEEE